jgi:hypothetical protein
MGPLAVVSPMAVLDFLRGQVWESQGERRALPPVTIPKRATEVDV